MTIIVRNTNARQARRTFETLAKKMLPGGTWYGEGTVADHVLRLTLTTPADWHRNGDLMAEDGGEEHDVTIVTNYYTCATVLGHLSRQMRARAEINGRPADDVCSEM